LAVAAAVWSAVVADRSAAVDWSAVVLATRSALALVLALASRSALASGFVW
jgi:hypothetical protein